jgi:hypothetical protein
MKRALRTAISLCSLSGVALVAVHGYQAVKALQLQQHDEVLTPLTDAERQLNPREMVLHQPDFVADVIFFVNEGFGGFGGASHVARKGSRYREESQFWTFVGEIGKTAVRLYPQAKLYNDMVPPKEESDYLFNPASLAVQPPNTFTSLGTVQFGGETCIEIEVAQPDSPEKIYLYAAPNLRNLILVSRIVAPKRSTIQRLTNVSFEVADSLVEIPTDFKSVQHDRWVKDETATVTYKNKPSKDFGVFRAPGGEFFIWVSDAYYPWHYIYRPKLGTVEIAYQGELVNRSGKFIWLTNETEAFSLQDYYRPGTSTVDAHLVVKPNGIKFWSNSYAQDGSIIDMTW